MFLFTDNFTGSFALYLHLKRGSDMIRENCSQISMTVTNQLPKGKGQTFSFCDDFEGGKRVKILGSLISNLMENQVFLKNSS